ncbi:MAG: hypothetical protein GC162_09995 [Planctomycetes bacterium]|nr:hypothetical protein [Planctomycetota bacterium]
MQLRRRFGPARTLFANHLRYTVRVDYRRNFQPGGTFFFTLVTYRRRRLFDHDAARDLLREIVGKVKAEHPFRMVAWVVLPDHLHMIWTLPPGDADFSSRWSTIKGRFTRRWLGSGGLNFPYPPARNTTSVGASGSRSFLNTRSEMRRT